MKYISESGEEAIRNFKYKGGSVAYSYQYVWSPVAQFILKYIPQTWAPNTITVIGTLINIAGSLLLIAQQRGEKLIPWTMFVYGLCVIIYYNMDNIDGKQARRTGNSSPLGMCMDHGCDALGVSFFALAVAQLVLKGDPFIILISSQIAVLGSFWLATWSQYHSKGILLLGKFNAVDDGIPLVSFLGFFTFFVGQNFWLIQIAWGYRIQDLLVAFIWIAGAAQIIGFVSGGNFTKDVKGALMDLIHFILLAGTLCLIVNYTDWHYKYFFAIYFSSVLPVVRDTSYMHICVVAQQKYNQYQFTTLFYVLSFSIYIGVRQFLGFNLIPEKIFVYGVLFIIAGSYFHYVISVSRQMASVLNIRIFHVKEKNK